MKPLHLFCGLLMALVTIFPAAGETANRAPVSLQTVSGDTLKGTVSGVREGVVSLITEFGVVRVPLDKLTPESREQLDPPADGDTAGLKARIAELEALVEQLRQENATLRRQTPPPVAPVQRFAAKEAGEKVAPSPQAGTGSYWISNTGKRHNSRCRFYQNSQGRNGGADDGVACKICGG